MAPRPPDNTWRCPKCGQETTQPHNVLSISHLCSDKTRTPVPLKLKEPEQ